MIFKRFLNDVEMNIYVKIYLKKKKKFSSGDPKKNFFSTIRSQKQLKLTKNRLLNFQNPMGAWGFYKNSNGALII